jgi:magnesium transporter
VIVDCAIYRDGVRQTPALDIESIEAHLESEDGFVWLGLRTPTRGELLSAWKAVGAPEDCFDVDEALEPHARPVLTVEPHLLWLVLRTARYDDVAEDVHLGQLTVLVGERFVISIRYGEASPLADLRKELEEDNELIAAGPEGVLAAIVHQIVEDYRPAIDGFENDAVEVEREVFSDERQHPVQRLYALKREVRELLLAIVPLQDPLERLLRITVTEPSVVAEHLRNANHGLNLLIQRVRSLSELLDAALNATLTQVSLRQNEDMRKISAWVAIGVIPTGVAAVYGMNFDHMPELRWEYGYPAVMALIALACLLLYRFFKKSGWL